MDLHALTGWIPDREPIRLSEPTFDQEKLFNKILDRHTKGDVLMTLATGNMSPEREEETGLANCHAYAVLNVVQVDVSFSNICSHSDRAPQSLIEAITL